MKALVLSFVFLIASSAAANVATWDSDGLQGLFAFIEIEREVKFCRAARGTHCWDPVVWTSLSSEERGQLIFAALDDQYFYQFVEKVYTPIDQALSDAFPELVNDREYQAFLDQLSDELSIVRVHITIEDEMGYKDWWDFYEIYDGTTNKLYMTKPFNFGQN